MKLLRTVESLKDEYVFGYISVEELEAALPEAFEYEDKFQFPVRGTASPFVAVSQHVSRGGTVIL